MVRIGFPKIAAVVIVALSYKWKHNTLVSIVVGTAGYMILCGWQPCCNIKVIELREDIK